MALDRAQLLVLHHKSQHHLDRLPAQRFLGRRRADILAEDLGKRRPVGDIEEAQRADLPVNLKRVEAGAELAIGQPAFI